MIPRNDSEFPACNFVGRVRCEAGVGVRYFVIHLTLLNAITVKTPSDYPSTLCVEKIREVESRRPASTRQSVESESNVRAKMLILQHD